VAGVCIEGLRKAFGGQSVVDVDALEIRDGEFFSLLGPSGCGKTTTLRLLAGLAEPDGGRITIGTRDVTNVPTAQRNLGMVFQHYALFPHLTVRQNVAFPLRERGVASADMAARVNEALALVALPEMADRLPRQLSGGQQQRVAMARAVVYRPDVLLLDEPLSSLDAKLRVAMRAELKRLQRTIGITTIFVTHDQQEALALSDRIGVMRASRMEQVGTPAEIYDTPQTAFVADFVGGTNVLAGVVSGSTGGSVEVTIARDVLIRVPHAGTFATGAPVNVAVKPERVKVGDAAGVPDGAAATVEAVSYLGSGFSYVVRIDTQQVEARVRDVLLVAGRPARAGDRVAVAFDPPSLRIVDR
jgi:spermidine/putrescine ABC transporter ATP-binding subunit